MSLHLLLSRTCKRCSSQVLLHFDELRGAAVALLQSCLLLLQLKYTHTQKTDKKNKQINVRYLVGGLQLNRIYIKTDGLV